jgi:hypothetical protein
VTWEFLAGGGALAAAGAIFGLVQQVRLGNAQHARDRAVNELGLVSAALKSANDELAAERAAVALEADTRETVVAAQRLRIAALEMQLEKHAADDPALAGELLDEEFQRPDDAEAPGVQAPPGSALGTLLVGQGRD